MTVGARGLFLNYAQNCIVGNPWPLDRITSDSTVYCECVHQRGFQFLVVGNVSIEVFTNVIDVSLDNILDGLLEIDEV